MRPYRPHLCDFASKLARYTQNGVLKALRLAVGEDLRAAQTPRSPYYHPPIDTPLHSPRFTVVEKCRGYPRLFSNRLVNPFFYRSVKGTIPCLPFPQ